MLPCRETAARHPRGQPLLRALGERHAGLPHLPEPLRPEPGQVDEAGQSEQRLVRRDVGRGLLTADVLLAGLQGEDIAALARGVGGLADDPARHAAGVVRLSGDEPVVRAAEGLEVARALPLADGDRATVVAGSLQHAERDRVDVRNRQRLRLVRGGGEVGCRLQTAEEVRLLENRAGRVATRGCEHSGSVVPPRCGTSTTSSPNPGAYVFTTWRTCGLTVSARTTFDRPVACLAMKQASAATVVPS